MNDKMFSGLHGKITLICRVCNKRHSPRCDEPDKKRAEIEVLIKQLGYIFSEIYNSEEPYQGEYDEEKKEILKRLEKLTGKTI